MANANKIIDKKIKDIKAIIIEGARKTLTKRIKEKLIEKIEDNFYFRYDVGEAPHWLIDSLDIEVNFVNDHVIVFVYFNETELIHTTWWGMDGIQANDKVYTPQWINDGFTFDPYTGERMNEIGGVWFLEDTLKELESDTSFKQEFYNYLKSKGIRV